jgi:hypothetical protein
MKKKPKELETVFTMDETKRIKLCGILVVMYNVTMIVVTTTNDDK